MQMYDIIAKKRDGAALTDAEIGMFIHGYTVGEIPDYQASALLMAICLRGMNRQETLALTLAMRDSGDRLDLSAFGGRTVDKHSTGGVGDKTSLIVAPLAASLGCKVAKMSGRGLGHTGGTVDKLESISGFHTELTTTAFRRQVETVGVAIIGQSQTLAPADKKLYALRDVTATVDCIPLIASSIMSKKLAAGTDHIVLDVTVGSGAFMRTEAQARQLAETMVEIGRGCGKQVRAVLTDMDAPLGRMIGNALEVREAVSVLRGGACPDLRTVSLELAAHMVSLCLELPEQEARVRVERALNSGAAYDTFCRWIAAQGGDLAALQQPEAFWRAKYQKTVLAPADGVLISMETKLVGEVAMLLGAGRERKEDPIDFSAGIELLRKPGETVTAGEPLAVLYSSSVSDMTAAAKRFEAAVTVSDEAPMPRASVLGVIG